MKKLILILTFACGLMTLQAENVNLRKSVEDGIKTSIQHTENREWKEAFATCRALDGMINMEEQKTKKAAPELHYLVSKERLRMYMRLLNKQKECQEQLKKMEDWAEKAQSDEVSEDLLMTKAGYYQKFGMNDKSLQCYKELVQHRSKGKDEQGVDKCFQDMLAQAKENKNTSLSRALERLYTNWQDSIKAVKAAQELKALQDDYAASQNILAEKKSEISAQKGTIIFLCILVIALAGGLLFFIGIMLKNIRQIKTLKKSLSIANENNESKSRFINKIGEQMTPSLDAIEAGQVKPHVKGLKELMAHIQTYMELESNRESHYEMKDLNINALCDNILNKAKETFQPGVEAVLNVPRVNVRTNAEALENVLLYLLGNAALHTESGKITLEFKKRSAHSGQFIVTDTGTGIPEEKRANLFKPFAEVQDLTKGDGLGLPTCSLIAYKLNGTLRLDEEYKKGTRFVLELRS
ncbi:MAG: HAMP domain-containing histidine kinase [Clostridia bacterium]|nr:HAMP domain-containing histidine kinase [Clostridia bacterium]